MNNVICPACMADLIEEDYNILYEEDLQQYFYECLLCEHRWHTEDFDEYLDYYEGDPRYENDEEE